jgi:CAAX protease family protein
VGRRALTWRQLLPIGILLSAGPLALQLAAAVRPNFEEVGRAAAALPAAIAFGVFNAAQEEFRFRAALLPRLTPAIGGSQAMLLTATVFGIAHWHGHPSGPTGILLAGLAGWWLARSMIETRGSFWAWSVHAVLDVMIFVALVMAP